MLRKSQLHFRKSLTIWSFVLIILVSSVHVKATKAHPKWPRESGRNDNSNSFAIALSQGGSRRFTGTVQTQRTRQVHPPSLNNNNQNPIERNIPASNTPVQPKTVSNTNTGFQTPAHNAAPNAGYPQQGVRPPQQGRYKPQQSNVGYKPQQGYHPAYPQGVNNPNPSYQQPMDDNGQQTPIMINNYIYQEPQTGGTGSSKAKNALLLGAGGLAGAAIHGALKPGEKTKTVAIHRTVPSQPPNVSPNLAAAAPTTVQASETNVPLGQAPSNIPSPQHSTVVPLVFMPDTTGISQPIVPIMPGSETTIAIEPIVPLVPMSDSLPIITEQRSSNNNTTNAEIPVSTSTPVAPFAEVSPSSHLKAFNIFVYAAISMILAKILKY